MKKEYRIKKSSEIDAIFKLKQSKGNRFFVVYTHRNTEETHFRFALSVGKKYGNAVERNLIKRRIREIVQTLKEQFTCSNFVIVIKPPAKALNYQDMKENLKDLFEKSKIMETNYEKH